MELLDFRIPTNGSESFNFRKFDSTRSELKAKFGVSTFSFDLTCVCVHSLPLPDETNVHLWYYLDWIVQLCCCLSYYMMLCTIVLFFIGVSIYIGGMVDDLKMTITEFEDYTDTITNQLRIEITFHKQLLV